MSDTNQPDEVVECWFCPNQAGSPRIWLKWFFGKRIPVCQECRVQAETLWQLISEANRRKAQGR